MCINEGSQREINCENSHSIMFACFFCVVCTISKRPDFVLISFRLYLVLKKNPQQVHCHFRQEVKRTKLGLCLHWYKRYEYVCYKVDRAMFVF